MARQPIVIIACARKGGGKSHVTAHHIENYLKDTPTKKGRKCLIFDPNSEWNLQTIRMFGCSFPCRPLALKDLAAWSKSDVVECRRILPLDSKNQLTQSVKELESILNTVLTTYTGGLLVLEDLNSAITVASSSELVSFITRTRQKSLDVLIHFQSLRAIPPRILANSNVWRFYKVNEPVSSVEAKLNNPELFYVAEALIAYKFRTDIRFFCYVDNEMDSIYGKFSLMDFRIAAFSYLKERRPNMLRLALNRLNKDENAAYKFCISELINKYYGNPLKTIKQ